MRVEGSCVRVECRELAANSIAFRGADEGAVVGLRKVLKVKNNLCGNECLYTCRDLIMVVCGFRSSDGGRSDWYSVRSLGCLVLRHFLSADSMLVWSRGKDRVEYIRSSINIK